MKQVRILFDGARRHPELLLVALLVAIVAALMVPLPPGLLDALLVANLGLSLTLLISAVHLRGPLALSTFPTLLLVATLFRLSLNVSSTRLILGEGGAGRVIDAFGRFVVGGSYLVGAVVFVIILIVQFLVVAKGAERVAEVGARFTLDALPGKQMAIDADMRAGACTQEEAGERRRALEQESQFYGSLDGAMKFVKGDAIAGLLITAINVVGGLTIGVAVHGLAPTESAETYTILSIGDGLVSQIPALLTAVAAGLVVTRVGSGSRLGADVVAQLAAQPRALIASGVVLLVLGLVPGLPVAPFALLGCFGVGLGAWLLKRGGDRDSSGGERATLGSKDGAEEQASLEHASMIVVLGQGVDPEVAAALAERALPKMRRSLVADMGLPLPPVPVVRGASPGRGYEVLVHQLPILRGEVPAGPTIEASPFEVGLLGLGGGVLQGEGAGMSGPLAPLEGPEPGRDAPGRPGGAMNEADGLPNSPESGPDAGPSPSRQSVLLDEASRARAEAAGLAVTAPEDRVAAEVKDLARARAGELLSLDVVQELLDAHEKGSPALVREATSRAPVPLLWEVMVRLLEEGVSIRPLERILEAVARNSGIGSEPHPAVALTEVARGGLSRHIVHDLARGAPLPVVLLDPMVEDLLRSSIVQIASGPVLALPPAYQEKLIDAMRRELGEGGVLLTSADLRRHVWGLTRSSVPGASVLSYNELPREARVQPVARLMIEGLEPAMLTAAA